MAARPSVPSQLPLALAEMRARDDATSGDGAGIAAVSALHAASTIDMKRSLGLQEQQARVLGTLAPSGAAAHDGVVDVVG